MSLRSFEGLQDALKTLQDRFSRQNGRKLKPSWGQDQAEMGPYVKIMLKQPES